MMAIARRVMLDVLLVVAFLAMVALVVTCGVTDMQRAADIEAERELRRLLWPMMVTLIQDDEDIPEQDRRRIYRALGVLLALEGQITLESANDPNIVAAKAEALMREYSTDRMARLTRRVHDTVQRQQMRDQLDQVTIDAARAVTGR